MQQINRRKTWVDAWTSIQRKLHDGQALLELAVESSDESLGTELQTEITDLENREATVGKDVKNLLA